jgi:hypothetical protein
LHADTAAVLQPLRGAGVAIRVEAGQGAPSTRLRTLAAHPDHPCPLIDEG